MPSSIQLPEQWMRTRLGDLFELQLGKMVSKHASSGPQHAPYLSNRHVQWDRIELNALDTMSFNSAEREKYSLQVGDLLVCEGGEVGRTALYCGEATGIFFQKAIHRLRPLDHRIEPSYMLRFMRRAAATGAFADLVSQTSIAHLTREKLALLEIPMPPLPEQQKIAEILDTVDEAIRKTDQIIAKLKQVKQGLLHDLLTRGIDHNGELRDPERHPEQFKDSPLGRIPRPWTVQALDCCVSAPITYGIVQAGPHIPGGVPYIRTGDMSGDRLQIGALLRTSDRIAQSYTRSRVEVGEIVCAIRATVGKVLRVPGELHGANLTQGTARIAPNTGMNGTFLLWALRGQAVQRQFDLSTKGTTFQEITLSQLRQLMMPVPQLREQKDIGLAMQSLVHKEDAEILLRDKLRHAKQGLMNDLLTGRVRVTNLLETTP